MLTHDSTNKGPWSDEDISMCLSAPNCYIEDTGTSTEIRLNTTHELTGVAKRAAGPHTTKITIGKNMINCESPWLTIQFASR